MYKYKYVEVELERGISKTALIHHREIIDNHAAEGWRFVGTVTTREYGYGMLGALDLVFEKEEK